MCSLGDFTLRPLPSARLVLAQLQHRRRRGLSLGHHWIPPLATSGHRRRPSVGTLTWPWRSLLSRALTACCAESSTVRIAFNDSTAVASAPKEVPAGKSSPIVST